jgi:hypothetical protein
VTRPTPDHSLPPDAAPGGPDGATARLLQLANLRAVVVALDTRTAHPERAGEAAIAADSSALRVEALRRIDQIEGDDHPR